MSRPERSDQDWRRTLPGPMAGAFTLMAQPMRDAAMMSALSVSLAGEAFGFWMRSMTHAVELSQKMLSPAAATPPPAQEPAVPAERDQRSRPAATVLPFQALRREEPVGGAKAPETAEPALPPVGQAGHLVADAPGIASVSLASLESSAAPLALEVGSPAPAVLPLAKARRKGTRRAGPAAASQGTQPAGRERPATPDDLKQLSGVGPKLEKVLNGLGIWTIAQVAAWSEGEAEWIDAHLSLGGRVRRDGWVETARKLAGAA